MANAARAVQDLSDDAEFFEYSHALLENQSRYSFGLVAAVHGAAKDGRYRPALEADRRPGREMNLRGTPEVYVNGTRVANYAYATVREAIESEI